MRSKTLELYKRWLETATPEQVALVDSIYHECEQHYEAGGSTIVECYTPEEILADFASVADAKEYCGLKVEQALNARWGEDSDEQVETARRFDEWV